jgi:lipoprotein-anchoring transpeptidase ErfK/SrfK
MHSVKNTVIAVGLLGLSFLFYNSSTKPGTESEIAIPTLNISEGLDGIKQLATDGMNAVNSKLDSVKSDMGSSFDSVQQKVASVDLSQMKVPNLNQPMQNIANQVTDQANQFAGEFKSQAQSTASNLMNKANDAISLDAPISPKATYNQLKNEFSNSFQSQSNPAPMAGQTSAQAQRDAGLIAALDTQKTHNVNSNSFAANNTQTISVDNSFSTASSPPTSDSSFNQMASNMDSQVDTSSRADSPRSTGMANLTMGFEAAWSQADSMVRQQEYRGALELLTKYYKDPSLNASQRKQLMTWLDGLAGKVIFSTEHHLSAAPHYVGANESLASLGARWNVPAQLIYNINKDLIPNTNQLATGVALKQIQGPFDAEIDLQTKMLTVYLNGMYATRFPVRIGISGTPRPGSFEVMVKSAAGHSWRNSAGKEYPATAPENQYGPHWIGMTGSLCIHAVSQSTADGHFGCIGLREADAKDVFAILGKGSTVTIQ